jgi:hypothetical protein
MAKYYAGQDGSVEFADSPVAKVVQWSLTANTDALEVTALNENVRSFTTGLRTASGALTVLYYDDAPVSLLDKVTKTDPTESPLVKLKLKFDAKPLHPPGDSAVGPPWRCRG